MIDSSREAREPTNPNWQKEVQVATDALLLSLLLVVIVIVGIVMIIIVTVIIAFVAYCHGRVALLLTVWCHVHQCYCCHCYC